MSSSGNTWRTLALELAAFAVLTVSISSLWQHNGALLLLIAAICAGTLALWHARGDVVFFLVLMLLGTLAEVVFVRYGVWHYANPTALGIPLWFPPAFGTAGVIGQRLAATLTGLWEQALRRRSSPVARP